MTGTIFEPSAGGPIPLAGINVFIHQPGQFVKTTTTDGKGRYAAKVVLESPSFGNYVVQANKASYEQPCAAAGTVPSGTVTTKDVELYSDATLSAGGTAPLGSSPVIVGTVSRDGYPVAGANVQVVDASLELVLAYTITSSEGRYFVCRVPDNHYLSAFTGDSQSEYHAIGVATDQTVDLTLLTVP